MERFTQWSKLLSKYENYKILITQSAKNDLSTIKNRFSTELNEPNVALKLIENLKKSILSLSKTPERNPLLTDEMLVHLEIRKLIVKKYIVFYYIQEDTIIVMRVLYMKRDWHSILY